MSAIIFKELLHNLGNEIGLPQLAPDAQGYCCLQFDEKIVVNIQYVDNSQNLLLFTSVGALDEKNRRKGFEKMLQANLFWQDTGGSTLGVDPETFTVIMAYQEPIRGVDYQRFRGLLETFVNTSELWMKRIGEFNQQEEKKAEGSIPQAFPPGMKV